MRVVNWRNKVNLREGRLCEQAQATIRHSHVEERRESPAMMGLDLVPSSEEGRSLKLCKGSEYSEVSNGRWARQLEGSGRKSNFHGWPPTGRDRH